MNQPTGWGNGQGNAWGQPAPAAPPQQSPQLPPGPPATGFAQPAYPQQPPQQPPAGFAPPQQAMNFAANPFAGLTSGDQTAVRNPYLEEGDYKLKIAVIKGKPARSGKLLYIIETEIVESNNPNRPPGMHCASFIDLSNRDLAGRHIAAFVTAVHGFDPQKLPKDSPVAPWVEPGTGKQEAWGDYAAYSASDANPWAGRLVGCRVNTIETKAGEDFSLHTWTAAATMVIGPMRPMAVPQMPAAVPQMLAGQPAWPTAPQGAPAAAPAQTPNWGTPPAQGWGQPGR